MARRPRPDPRRQQMWVADPERRAGLARANQAADGVAERRDALAEVDHDVAVARHHVPGGDRRDEVVARNERGASGRSLGVHGRHAARMGEQRELVRRNRPPPCIRHAARRRRNYECGPRSAPTEGVTSPVARRFEPTTLRTSDSVPLGISFVCCRGARPPPAPVGSRGSEPGNWSICHVTRRPWRHPAVDMHGLAP